MLPDIIEYLKNLPEDDDGPTAPYVIVRLRTFGEDVWKELAHDGPGQYVYGGVDGGGVFIEWQGKDTSLIMFVVRPDGSARVSKFLGLERLYTRTWPKLLDEVKELTNGT